MVTFFNKFCRLLFFPREGKETPLSGFFVCPSFFFFFSPWRKGGFDFSSSVCLFWVLSLTHPKRVPHRFFLAFWNFFPQPLFFLCPPNRWFSGKTMGVFSLGCPLAGTFSLTNKLAGVPFSKRPFFTFAKRLASPFNLGPPPLKQTPHLANFPPFDLFPFILGTPLDFLLPAFVFCKRFFSPILPSVAFWTLKNERN